MISVPGKITSVNSNTKKTEVKFEISSEVKFEDLIELQKLIGMRVFADFSNSQQALDDIDDDDHEGIPYSVDTSGVATVSQDQTSIEDYIDNAGMEVNENAAEEEQQEEDQESDSTVEEEQTYDDSLPDLTEDPDIDPADLPFPLEDDKEEGPGF